MSIEIVSEEEAEKADAVMVIRVKDAKRVASGSVITQCSLCHEDVWLAPTSPVKPRKVCVDCVLTGVANVN